MFPQLGAPVGFLFSGGIFLVLSRWLTDQQFFAFGWRIPFLASAALVMVGLYVRLTITETPVFRDALTRRERVKVPLFTVFRDYPGPLLSGTLLSLATFVLFYLMTVFALSWGTTALGYSREKFLVMQLVGILFFAAGIPIGGTPSRTRPPPNTAVGDLRHRRIRTGDGSHVPSRHGRSNAMMALGLTLMGLTYGPLGTVLSELFPTQVRYTGSSLTFNLAGIFGASFAPYIATGLAKNYGLQYVGYYLFAAAVLTIIGLLATRETRDDEL